MSGPINTVSLIAHCREILEEIKPQVWWINHDLLIGGIDRLERMYAENQELRERIKALTQADSK